MSNWLSIDPEKYSEPEQKKIRGVDITVYPSPYDIPEATRGYYDKEREKFIIEFRYIGERHEKLISKTTQEHLKLIVGKKTDRIYEIEFDAKKSGIDQVNLQMHIPVETIDRAVETLNRESENSANRRNYLLSSKIVDSRKNDLFELQAK